MVPSAQPRPVSRRLLEAGVLAGLAFLAVVPHMHYLTRVAFADAVKRRFSGVPLAKVLEADLAVLGILIAICAVAGSLLAERYGMAGLGNLRSWRASLRWTLPGGALLSLLTYLLFGRHLARLVPGYYPSSPGWAVVVLFKGALFDEMIARHGVMSILGGATRRPWIANLLQALIFTWLTTHGLSFHGVELQWSWMLAASLTSSMVVHLALGAVCARHGLAASSTMHAVVDLKYPARALLSGATGR